MTVKERLHQLIDTLSPAKLETAERLLTPLHEEVATEAREGEALDREFHSRLAERGITVTPAAADAELPRLIGTPGGMTLSDLVIQMREERYQSL